MDTPEKKNRGPMAEFISDSLNWTNHLQGLLEHFWDVPPDTKASYATSDDPDAMEEVILEGEALKGFRAAIAMVMHELRESPSIQLMLKMQEAGALKEAVVVADAPSTV